MQCWTEVPERAGVCPNCHDDIVARLKRADCAEKLAAALWHEDPVIRVRAAWMLGERGAAEAVTSLCRLARESTDVFAVESALEALAKIGDPRAAATVRWAAKHASPLVRSAAARAVASAIFRKST